MKCPSCKQGPLVDEQNRQRCYLCGYSAWKMLNIRRASLADQSNYGPKSGRKACYGGGAA